MASLLFYAVSRIGMLAIQIGFLVFLFWWWREISERDQMRLTLFADIRGLAEEIGRIPGAQRTREPRP